MSRAEKAASWAESCQAGEIWSSEAEGGVALAHAREEHGAAINTGVQQSFAAQISEFGVNREERREQR